MPRNHRICNFSKYNNIDDHFISFSIVKEAVMLEIKTFYMSLTFDKEVNELLSEIKKKFEMNSKREFIRFKVLTSYLRRLTEDSGLSSS